MADDGIRGCLTSEQSLADFAEIILSAKNNLSATTSPVIVLGGSYGGLLAAWFRLKYPHIAIGALASSAPVLAFDGITPEDAACAVVSKDFREHDKKCYNTIRESWKTIDKIASEENGLRNLTQIFRSCRPLQSSGGLKKLLANVYTLAAQYNGRFSSSINSVCNAILGTNDPVNGIANSISVILGDESCHEILVSGDNHGMILDLDSYKPWRWQMCTELVIPKGCSNDSMLPPSRFNLTAYTTDCVESYGVLPQPHWITTYYGGLNIEETLRKFGSNIIFSNGLRDPLSSGGVLEDISSTILAIKTKQGSHCLDLPAASPDDPKWLVHQRQKELRVFGRWIKEAKRPNGGSNSQPKSILIVFLVV